MYSTLYFTQYKLEETGKIHHKPEKTLDIQLKPKETEKMQYQPGKTVDIQLRPKETEKMQYISARENSGYPT